MDPAEAVAVSVLAAAPWLLPRHRRPSLWLSAPRLPTAAPDRVPH